MSIDRGLGGIQSSLRLQGYTDGPASLPSIPPSAALREARGTTGSPECSVAAMAAVADGRPHASNRAATRIVVRTGMQHYSGTGRNPGEAPNVPVNVAILQQRIASCEGSESLYGFSESPCMIDTCLLVWVSCSQYDHWASVAPQPILPSRAPRSIGKATCNNGNTDSTTGRLTDCSGRRSATGRPRKMHHPREGRRGHSGPQGPQPG